MRGFTLLEVLIALFIVMLAAVYIMGLFSQESRVAARARFIDSAMFLAQGKMEDLLASGSAFRVPVQTGSFNPPFEAYRYRVEVSRYGPKAPDLKMISIAVTGPMGESAKFSTLRKIAAAAVAAGGFHSLALKDDGTAWSWGDNRFGQLGANGQYQFRAVPAPVCDSESSAAQCPDFSQAVSAVGGFRHSLLLREDGTVWGFGYNAEGQLGDRIKANRNGPVQVVNCRGCGRGGLSGVSGISASVSGDFSLAVKSDGTVWSWGDNKFAELGNGEQGRSSFSAVPVQVCAEPALSPGSCFEGLSGVAAAAAGGYHALVLKDDGTVWAWGGNNFGQLGNNGSGPEARSLTPVQVCQKPGAAPGDCDSFLAGVTAVAAGAGFSLALKSDGTVWAWGNDYLGYLGDNNISSFSPVPVQVCAAPGQVPGKCGSVLRNVSAIAAGADFSLALKSDGTVWAWGGNYFGQLGNNGSGPANYSSVPVEVCASPGPLPGRCGSFLQGIASVTAGYRYALALTRGGMVWGWGNNAYGQLGDGANTVTRPYAVPTVRF